MSNSDGAVSGFTTAQRNFISTESRCHYFIGQEEFSFNGTKDETIATFKILNLLPHTVLVVIFPRKFFTRGSNKPIFCHHAHFSILLSSSIQAAVRTDELIPSH